jgi:hypothetical protein
MLPVNYMSVATYDTCIGLFAFYNPAGTTPQVNTQSPFPFFGSTVSRCTLAQEPTMSPFPYSFRES